MILIVFTGTCTASDLAITLRSMIKETIDVCGIDFPAARRLSRVEVSYVPRLLCSAGFQNGRKTGPDRTSRGGKRIHNGESQCQARFLRGPEKLQRRTRGSPIIVLKEEDVISVAIFGERQVQLPHRSTEKCHILGVFYISLQSIKYMIHEEGETG